MPLDDAELYASGPADKNANQTDIQSLELSVAARQAAWGLVEHHQKGHAVAIRAQGHIEDALEDLTQQFMGFGTRRVIAEELAHALVSETLDHIGAFGDNRCKTTSGNDFGLRP